METVYHTAGSCKRCRNALAAVDSELKVHGVDHFHDIDSSIMPIINGSNIHGPTVIVAKKGAHMVLDRQYFYSIAIADPDPSIGYTCQ